MVLNLQQRMTLLYAILRPLDNKIQKLISSKLDMMMMSWVNKILFSCFNIIRNLMNWINQLIAAISVWIGQVQWKIIVIVDGEVHSWI